MNDVFDRDLGLAFPIGGEPLRVAHEESMHNHCDSSDATKKPNQTGLGGTTNQIAPCPSVSAIFRVPFKRFYLSQGVRT